MPSKTIVSLEEFRRIVSGALRPGVIRGGFIRISARILATVSATRPVDSSRSPEATQPGREDQRCRCFSTRYGNKSGKSDSH